jgi:cytochrome c5
MKSKHLILALLIATTAVSMVVHCVADDTIEHGEHRRESTGKKHRNSHAGDQTEQARNAVYEATCGSCHWAYPPQLLPKKSWEKTLASLGDHFGSAVQLSEQDQRTTSSYLLNNAADVSSSEVGRKIKRSLGGASPTRVTEVPYVQRKHHEISPEIFARQSVDGMANCIACHPGAASLDFEDDRVQIPAD